MKPRRSFFEAWPDIAKQLSQASQRYIFLDFDGTLAPIQSRPYKAFLSQKTRKKIDRLSRLPCTHVGIVSGRALSDLQKKVALKGVSYAGNHGFEIQNGTWRFLHPEARRRRVYLATLVRQLQKAVSLVKKAWVEDKRYTVSLHFREAPPSQWPLLFRSVHSLLRKAKRDGLDIRHGKRVIEIRPTRQWNKGAASLALARRYPKALPFYLGDDQTDEDAFRVLRRRGIGVKVGVKGRTQARFFLRSQRDTDRLLDHLIQLPCASEKQ